MATTEELVIDAIAADLEDNGDLVAHNLVKYRRPRAITPAVCPLMVVWLISKVSHPESNVRFGSDLTVGVSWHEETVAEAQTLINNEATARALLDARGKIEARFRELARIGLGTENAWELLPGGSAFLAPEMAQGLTEGYVLQANVRLSEV